MNRPYVVMNMLANLNGKIDVDMENDVYRRGIEIYNQKHYYKEPNAYMSGSVTAAELCGEHPLDLREGVEPQLREDYIAPHEEQFYYVALDTQGKLPWAESTLTFAGRPTAHVIEVLTEDVSDAYIDFLRRRNISYIFCGKGYQNGSMTVVAEKLYSMFGIKVLKCAGGGGLNWAFQKEDLIDELAIVVCPLTDGDSNMPSLFGGKRDKEEGVFAYKLKAVEVIDDDFLWLRYLRK